MTTVQYWADVSFRQDYLAARAEARTSRSAWFRDALMSRGVVSLRAELEEDPGLLSWLTSPDRAVIQALAEEGPPIAQSLPSPRALRARAWWLRPRVYRALLRLVSLGKAVALLLLGLGWFAVFIAKK